MRYSQGDGVNNSLSRLVYCTHVYNITLSSVVSCVVFMGIFRGGHVLPGTLIIKIMCVNQIYLQG